MRAHRRQNLNLRFQTQQIDPGLHVVDVPSLDLTFNVSTSPRANGTAASVVGLGTTGVGVDEFDAIRCCALTHVAAVLREMKVDDLPMPAGDRIEPDQHFLTFAL